jgi:hypothetical protein
MHTQEDLDFLFNALIADTDALEDAKMTLEVIKNTDPDVYDEIIDQSLLLINKALNNSVMGIIGKILNDEDWYIAKENK